MEKIPEYDEEEGAKPSVSEMDHMTRRLITAGSQTLTSFVRKEITTHKVSHDGDPLGHVLLNPKHFDCWLGVKEFIDSKGFEQLIAVLEQGIPVLDTTVATASLKMGSYSCVGCVMACCGLQQAKPPAPKAICMCHHRCLLSLQLLANLLEKCAEETLPGTVGFGIYMDDFINDRFVDLLKVYMRIMVNCASSKGTNTCLHILSIIATMQPDILWANLGADAAYNFSDYVYESLRLPFQWLGASCLVEQFFGLTCIMNAIPLFYQIAVVRYKDCVPLTDLIGSLFVNIIHHVSGPT